MTVEIESSRYCKTFWSQKHLLSSRASSDSQQLLSTDWQAVLAIDIRPSALSKQVKNMSSSSSSFMSIGIVGGIAMHSLPFDCQKNKAIENLSMKSDALQTEAKT